MSITTRSNSLQDAVTASLMMLQVLSEEKRLEADFGQEYLDYKKKTGRFITFKR